MDVCFRKNIEDKFNLKYATHVKANRKGIIAHTAVTTRLNIPLGISFERKYDSAISCLKRILNFLFMEKSEKLPNLQKILYPI